MTHAAAPYWPYLRRKAIGTGVIFAVWLTVAFIMSLQMYVSARVTGAPQPWPQAFATALPWYLAWAFLTPAAVWLAVRFDFDAAHPWRFIAVHVPAGTGLTVCHAALYVAMATYLNRGNPHFPAPSTLIAIKLSGSLNVNLMIYAIIVGLVVLARAYARLRDREVIAARLEAQLADARTAALRAQMQPHFLFNTLNAISALVPEDPVRANRLIARLGDLLRLSLSGGGQTCTLAEELEFTDAYLAIEAERLGDRLTIVRHVDPAAMAVDVPALLLQPLAENAVRHGLAPRVRGGTLTLRAELRDGRLQLSVSDDGCGASAVRDGVGLGNTRLRLEQLYGGRQSLAVTTAPDEGFRVVITMPL